MLHLYDRASIALALTMPNLPPPLRERITNLTDNLIDWTEFLVVESGDTETDIVRHLGFSPLIEPIDGFRYPAPGFWPHWDWLADHGDWFEMIVTFGSTFAYVIFITNSKGVPSDLRAMCHQFATVRDQTE